MGYYLLVLMGLCLYWLLCMVILLHKIDVNSKIRIKWIDEIYDSQVSGDSGLNWDDLPEYEDTAADIKLWKYVPLKDYLKK